MNSIKPMHQWFMYLWEQRMDANGYVRCFECDGLMHQDTHKDLTTCYSHIIPKKPYPQYAGDPENVEIVHASCHALYTMKPKLAVNQYKKYLELKQKYNI